jgi:hypothetical protein
MARTIVVATVEVLPEQQQREGPAGVTRLFDIFHIPLWLVKVISLDCTTLVRYATQMCRVSPG